MNNSECFNEELINFTEVENTPFTVISKEEQHIVMLGKYRVSETFESKDEAIKDANSITWNRITQLITVMLRLNEEVKELKSKENE